ncbi:hypothetical protein G7Z17_g8486 [Cylindrodendrum hubeiense]|uniref:Zn(2)-C6 fungal-type domain-containing protein n=1 Tax=Cylindrodendrum hubeiense TaxID=595255 RepID=A0A9P5H8I0_9HYPO|nr:hypothetical protein G7Z17_g8486 [Cylindrodendrum hubeiense]
MQIPVSEPYGSANLDLAQQTTFAYTQSGLTSPPLTGFPLMPDQPTLTVPLMNDPSSGQPHGLPVAEYYTSQSLKQDPDLPNQSVMQQDPIVPQDLSAIQYGPDLGLVVAQEMTQQAMATAADMSQYGLVPTGQLDEALSQGIPSNGWSDVSLLDQHANFDILLPNQRGGKRGPFKDLNLREQTAQTRKIGSCIRCRMQRIRCENNADEEGGPCLTCKKVSNSRAGRFPCLRYKITDIRLFKPGQVPGFEWTRRWNNNISDPIQNWASEDLKTIYISDGLSNKCVEVQVRRFIPQAGDKLERTWDFKGMKRSVSIPPYALVKLDDVKRAYSEHIQESMREAFGSLLGRPESLLYQTYDRAWRIFRDPSTPMECLDLLGRTLMLWMSIRLSTRSSFIVGNETLGMPRDILDETSPNHGMIPLPPVLGAQLDLVLIHHIQTRLRRELLDRLQKMIQKNKQSTWLVTYLVTFILLHNTALITGHDAGYAKKHGMKRRFAREDKVKEYHLGANILLAHFHYCNKGIYPFSEGCKDQDLRTLAGLDEEKIQFVHATRANAKRSTQEWEELRDGAAYEDDYFFVSQLFEESWQPHWLEAVRAVRAVAEAALVLRRGGPVELTRAGRAPVWMAVRDKDKQEGEREREVEKRTRTRRKTVSPEKTTADGSGPHVDGPRPPMYTVNGRRDPQPAEGSFTHYTSLHIAHCTLHGGWPAAGCQRILGCTVNISTDVMRLHRSQPSASQAADQAAANQLANPDRAVPA